MIAAIGVEIEHRRFVRLLDLDGPSTGTLSLTTMAERQPRAIIRVLAQQNGRQELVQEISVRSIPPMPAGKPRIDLSGRFDGRRTLTLSVNLEGRPHTSATVDVRRWTGRRGTGWIAVAAILAIAALGAAVWWWLVPHGTTAEPAVPQIAEQATEPQAPAEQQQEPPAQQDLEAEQPSEAVREPASPADEAPGSKAAEPASEVAAGEPSETAPDESGTTVWPSVQAQRLAEGKVARVFFPPDSAELTAPAKAELDAILQVLSRNTDRRVSIIGHCALFGTEQGRIELSRARARAVRRYLLESGWQPADDPTIRGIGANEPITRQPDNQARNRRVELGFVDTDTAE